jgi:hypothetical protein
LFDEHLSAFDVDAAPDAAGFAWREANLVAEIVDALPNTVDPAVAERFVNRLRPGNAQLARAYLVVADSQYISFGMMLLKPRAERCRRLKKSWFHAHHKNSFTVRSWKASNDQTHLSGRRREL